jgi:anti-anti-sigma factor
MARTPFACTYDDASGTITLSGDLDERGARELHSLLTALMVERDRDLVVDLSCVVSLPSAVIGVLAAARADMRARFLHLHLVSDGASAADRVLPRAGMVVRPRRAVDCA